jgi:hypothetical protein
MDNLVDKAGQPLAAGIVTMYEDDSRTTLKNWYYQTGSPGNYSYVALPNPMTLSAAGTTQDANGNDQIPFFYPFDESTSTATVQTYYVTIYDSDNNLIKTIQNFPFGAFDSSPGTSNPNVQNIIVNNEFWRNGGTYGSGGSAFNGFVNNQSITTICPSQHDSFAYPDINFIIFGAAGDTETLTFSQFSNPPVLTDDITPEFYIDFNCSASTGSETYKAIMIPLSEHIATLEGTANCQATIQAKSVSGTASFSLAILPYAGTGTTFNASTALTLEQFSIDTNWTKYTLATPFTFPAAGSSISATGDDGYYLLIVLPTSITHIQFAKPQVYLSSEVSTNDFATYDEINSIISSPRTGDVRTSFNIFSPFGWIICNDSTIGSSGSGAATANVSTWNLYNLLWTNVSDTFAPVSTGRGLSAYADYTANKTMTLPLMLGRALIGLPPAFNVSSYSTSAPSWSATNGYFTLTTASTLLYVGMPVILTGTTLNAAFTSGDVYYVIPSLNASSNTQFQLASSYDLAIAGTAIAASGADTGTSIVITTALGGSVGQREHVQLERELATHNHPGSLGGVSATTGSSSGAVQGNTASAFSQTLQIANDGSSYPFNIVQPSTYMHVYLKL